MAPSSRRRSAPLLFASALLALAPIPSLAALYWDADGSTAGNNISTGANLGGSGNWEDAGKWFDGVSSDITWSSPGDAVFTGSTGTVTLNSPQPATSLSFKTSGYTVTGSTLTLGPTPANITTDAGVTATIASTIAGSATMTKLGAGTLVLANNNNTNTATSSEGGWKIEGGGTLVISADGALGVSPGSGITDIQINQSTIKFGADVTVAQSRRTKVNTNSSTQNLGDAVFDVNEHTVSWFGSIQGGFGTVRVTDANDNGGMLILGTDKALQSSINPFGSALPAGTVNLTVEKHCVVQTSGTVTPTGGELGSETGANGERLAIKLQGGGQIRAESGDYTFQRDLILGPGGGSLDTGAWIHTFSASNLSVSGPGALSKFGTGRLVIDNQFATWAGGTFIHSGTMQLGVGGSNGLLPGTLASPSSVVIDAGATLKFLRGSNKSFFDVISGGGGVTVANSNNAKVRLVSNNTYTGLTRIESGVLMIGQGNPGEPGSIVSDVLDNGNLDFNRVEDIGYGGTISGTGSVTKEAAGKLTLTGSSSYNGGTTVSAGTLIAANTTGSATGSGAVTVASGATLAGAGTIAGAVTINSGGHLAPGTSAGNLTVGSLLLNSGSVLDYELGAPGTGDRATITSSGGLSLNGGTVNVAALTGFGVGQYPILDYTGPFTGSATNLMIGSAPSGYVYSFVNNLANTSIDLVVAVPEPSCVSLSIALVALFASRRGFRDHRSRL